MSALHNKQITKPLSNSPVTTNHTSHRYNNVLLTLIIITGLITTLAVCQLFIYTFLKNTNIHYCSSCYQLVLTIKCATFVRAYLFIFVVGGLM